ncbi:MAG TPA: tyrosine-protein phosphatase [Candidatus Limnocylindrales bacterium]|nr:tyrosine-protein phosphatase [Candidatus Limnocylindrales bacterium]
MRQRQEVQALSRGLTLTDLPPERILDWEGCFNVRDLGGLPAADGSRLKWGALVRSDIPTRLTQAGREALVAHGITSIVDVRFAEELAEDDDRYPFLDATDGAPRRHHVPFHFSADDGPDAARHAAYAAAETRADLIRLDLDLNQSGITAAAAAIVDAQPGGVMVHCHAGKDRTGIIVGVILAFLGVPDDEIADDYALTQRTFAPLVEEWLDSETDDAAERERLVALAWPSREAMLSALEHLRARYRSAADYLRDGGMTDEQLDRLRSRLLEET